jgi:hypothetical protein
MVNQTCEHFSLPITVSLIYPKIENEYTNILLIDNQVPDHQVFIDSVNSVTFPIVYSIKSTKKDLLELLSNFKKIDRIGICSRLNTNDSQLFLDNTPLFSENSENIQFLIDMIKQLDIKNIDFLACDTLNYPNWVSYYDILSKETGVIVGASNNKTGNIKYGGDWILESTGEDIEFIYFTQKIENYTHLLDTFPVTGLPAGDMYGMAINGNYMYVGCYGSNIISKIDITVDPATFTTFITTGNTFTTGIVINTIGTNTYMYIASFGGTISLYDITTGTPSITPVVLSVAVAGPVQIFIYNNNLYVAGGDTKKVYAYSLKIDGTIDTILWTSPVLGGGIWGVATDGIYIYASDFIYGQIVKISLADGSLAMSIPVVTGFSTLRNLAIYGNYLYAADYNNNYIVQINLSDATSSNWTAFNIPVGLLVSDNFLYVGYNNGTTVNKIVLSPSQPSLPITCFLEDTNILTINGYKPIQNLRKGDFIKTLKNGYVPLNMIGFSQVYNSLNNANKDKLYICSSKKYPELFTDLIITGTHSILVDDFKGTEEEQSYKLLGDIYETDGKLRLPICIDDRAIPYNKYGLFNIYHIALDNQSYYSNYGIYANGLLVESCSLRYLTELSGMELLH